jgi:ribulose-5-phosphate 4-epimerase/fuculose-1-phosphate aldolase
MSNEARLREQICSIAASMFARGLTAGSSGNISARLGDGRLLVTPTGSSFGALDPARLSRFDAEGRFMDGDKPTKEMPLHSAFYETRGARTGAVVHLHSTHSVAVSLLPDIRPGDPSMGDAVRGLAGKRSAVLLAHHGPVVAGKDLEAAAYAMEELEETAKLTLLTNGLRPKTISAPQVRELVEHFDVEWDD